MKKMTLKQFQYLIFSVILFSCSNKKQENDNPEGSFSEGEAKELNELLNSSNDSNNIGIVEKKTIGTEQSYIDSIWQLVARDFTNCQSFNTRKMANKNWSICNHSNEIDLYEVEYVDNNIRFTEKYLLKNKQLIYAVEWEKRPADVPDDEATWWNCEYIIQDDHVVDHISLGMGKTEDELFNVQDIINLWNSRKDGFAYLKK